MAKVAIILSGCGFRDGSEIYETTFLNLALVRHGHTYAFFAPDIKQSQVINHKTGKLDPHPARSVLEESARIARGKVYPLVDCLETEFDALVLPGGFGVAINLSDYATLGPACHVDTQLKEVVLKFLAKKTIGAICFAPIILGKIVQNHVSLKLTVGEKRDDLELLAELGMQPCSAKSSECIEDKQYRVLSTPGFMGGEDLEAIYRGIETLVKKI